jgi:hypothetical protein
MGLTSKTMMDIAREIDKLTGMHPDQVRAAKAMAIGQMQANCGGLAAATAQPYQHVSNHLDTANVLQPAPDPLRALDPELRDYVTAALKLLDCEVSWLYSPHDKEASWLYSPHDKFVRAVRSQGARVHEAKLIWSIHHPVLDLTHQWIANGRGGDETEWRLQLAEMADMIKDEKSWFVENKKDLPKIVPPPPPQMYGHGVVHPQQAAQLGVAGMVYGHGVVHPQQAAQLGVAGMGEQNAQGMQGQQNAFMRQQHAMRERAQLAMQEHMAKMAPPPMIDDVFDIKKSGWM